MKWYSFSIALVVCVSLTVAQISSTPQALNPELTNSTSNGNGPVLYYNGSGPVPSYDEMSPIPDPLPALRLFPYCIRV